MLLLQNGRVIDPKSGLDQVMDLVTRPTERSWSLEMI